MARITVIVGTFNRLNILKQCVSSILREAHEHCELIITEAGSTDGTVDYLLQNRIKVIQEGKRLGQAQSLNKVGLSLESDYLCWLSDDNVLREGALGAVIRILDQNQKIGMVALKVKDVTGPHINIPYIGGITSTGILNCNQGVIRTDLFKKIGGFDEELQDYFIDADLTTKVLLDGYEVVYTRDIAIDHYRNHDVDSWIGQKARKERVAVNQVWYEMKYPALVEYNHSFRKSKEFKWRSKFLSWMKSSLEKYDFLSIRNLFNERDWYNACECTFMPASKFVLTFSKPYYLIQSIPLYVRRQAQKTTRFIIEEAGLCLGGQAEREERRQKILQLINKQRKQKEEEEKILLLKKKKLKFETIRKQKVEEQRLMLAEEKRLRNITRDQEK